LVGSAIFSIMQIERARLQVKADVAAVQNQPAAEVLEAIRNLKDNPHRELVLG
jgi:hypothetical protein